MLLSRVLVALLVTRTASWTIPSLHWPPTSQTRGCGRREFATTLTGVATLACLPTTAWAARDLTKLQPDLVLILRVQEATSQETRLVRTGKYKELQRLNIKRAISFMLDNYELRDRFVRASAYAPADKQQPSLSYAQTAVESLVQILEYFPDKLVANDLTPTQTSFVLAALDSTSRSIDNFMEFMPPSTVDAAKQQIVEENELNEKEYPQDQGQILNIAKKPPPPPPPPPPLD